ncbi:MAG: tetratricopeptide repeat protein [Gammaproteobacteria bacterium]|nr:tetratricopeptide repeat protein [Gammaproteobacteria bacterium]
MMSRTIYTLFAAIIFSACNSTPLSDSAVSEVNDTDVEIGPLALIETTPLMRAPSHSSNAVTSIVIGAQSAMQKGNFQIAAAQLERAVRIEPRNPLLWHYLAKVRFNQGRYSLAANLASKSTLLAHGDEALRSRNASLIKQAQAAFMTK